MSAGGLGTNDVRGVFVLDGEEEGLLAGDASVGGANVGAGGRGGVGVWACTGSGWTTGFAGVGSVSGDGA